MPFGVSLQTNCPSVVVFYCVFSCTAKKVPPSSVSRFLHRGDETDLLKFMSG